MSALEDSRSGLNLRLAHLGQTHPGAPKDFEFLFRCLKDPAASTADSALEDSCSPLNADAPEFIPTLSHDCPVIGHFCEAIPEHSTVALSLDELAECRSAASAGPTSTPRRRRVEGSISSGDSLCAGTPTSQGTAFTFATSNVQELDFGTPTRGDSRSLNFPLVAPQSSSKKRCGAAKKRRAAVAAGSKAPSVKRSKSEERREIL